MRWTSPSWGAIVLGGLMVVAGFVLFFVTDIGSVGGAKNFSLVAPLLISGAILLGAGLLGLQQAWTECCDWDDGCECCGDDCTCGDCSCCRPGGGDHGHEGHEGHSH